MACMRSEARLCQHTAAVQQGGRVTLVACGGRHAWYGVWRLFWLAPLRSTDLPTHTHIHITHTHTHRYHIKSHARPGVAPTPVSLEKLCPCLARAEPPPLGEAPLGPHAPPGWKSRVQVWEV